MSPATALQSVTAAGGLSGPQVHELLALLMSGQVDAAQGGAILAAWSARGETAEELAAVVGFLLERAVRLPEQTACMDVCGTGGTGLTRFNVSTTVAFVLAAAGVPVAKHGNVGSARPNGSFDLLNALGVPYQLPPASLARLLTETGLCFLFARAMHPAVAAVGPMRKAAGRRTIFNLAGPLANPCRPTRQLVGVARQETAALVAEALVGLGVERAAVVFGHPGLDEVSLTGPTHVWEVAGGRARHQVVSHLHRHGLDYASLPGGDATENAFIFQRLLAGEERGPLLDLVAVNAALALDCWRGRPLGADPAGVDEARSLILSGRVQALYQRHRDLALHLAGSR